VLAYLSRYTQRVAISNSRLLAMDERGVTFKWKDHRAKGKTRYKAMTLAPEEFMRRFVLHVLPGGFHRIRHCGLLANGSRVANLALVRELLHVVPAQTVPVSNDKQTSELPIAAPAFVCRHCGHAMVILQTFVRGELIRGPPLPGCVP
jgi:Putative transposase